MQKTNSRRLSMLVCFAGTLAVAAGETTSETITVAVQGGVATFVANTNVPAISVKGKSGALQARVSLRRSAGGLQLAHIAAVVPVKTLATGMGVRDEHMRKYIFTTADGQTPDLRFEGQDTTCSVSGREATCQMEGMLTIRGTARPFRTPLKIREEGDGFKASADAVVKLSAYGIEQPSQFGVKTSDDVQLHLEFLAKPVPSDSAMLRGRK
jgi:polyisoprenoid-binding protein YceI